PADRMPLSNAEIAKLNEAELEKRIRQNDEDTRKYTLGVHSREYQEELHREHDALWAALQKLKNAPKSSTDTAPPQFIQSMSTEELFKERKRVYNEISKLAEGSSERQTLQQRADLFDKEFNTRREIYQ